MAKSKEAHAQFTQLKKVLNSSVKNKRPDSIIGLVQGATWRDMENAGYIKPNTHVEHIHLSSPYGDDDWSFIDGYDRKRSETMRFLRSENSADISRPMHFNCDDRPDIFRKIIGDNVSLLENPSHPTKKDIDIIKKKIVPKCAHYDCEKIYFPIFDDLVAEFEDFSNVLSKQNKPLRKLRGHVSKFANEDAIKTLNEVPKFLKNSKRSSEAALCNYDDYIEAITHMVSEYSEERMRKQKNK